MDERRLQQAATNTSDMEYLSLREEVMKRIESRQQLLSIALTLAGAFLGIGWGTGGAVALLLFPPLVTLLAVGWVQNEVRIAQINRYIRDVLTTQIPTLGFERYIQQQDQHSRWMGLPIEVMSIGGILLLTQILAILLGIFRFNTTSIVDFVLMALAVVSVGAMIWLIDYVRKSAR